MMSALVGGKSGSLPMERACDAIFRLVDSLWLAAIPNGPARIETRLGMQNHTSDSN